MDFRDQIGHEVSTLSTFVDSIAAPCVRVSRSEAFIDSSERFFQYISHLAHHTQKYLGSLSLDSMTGDDFDNNRQQLKTIRDAWRDLHRFIKPATNADTLSMPLALLQSLVRRIREIEGFGDVDFVIFHTDEFNYLQVNPTEFRLVVNKVALTLGAHEFERGLSLIGMPSSQSSGLFMNCLLAHEIGHFAFDRKSLLGFVKAEAEAAVNLEDKGKTTPIERNAMVEVVAQWAEELFCDLFAVMLIGPSYTLAYIEFFDIVNLLSRDNGLCEPKLIERLPFYPKHPSHIFRVQQQCQLLNSTGWWHQIKGGKSRHIRLMDHLLRIDLARYPTSDPRKEIPIRAFIRILPEVNRLVGEIVGRLDSCVHDYGVVQQYVREYLRNGVVPSTLTLRVDGRIEKIHPTDLATINSAFMFYLEEIGALLKGFSGPSGSDIQRRNHWIRRVESWATKALGDLQLIRESR